MFEGGKLNLSFFVSSPGYVIHVALLNTYHSELHSIVQRRRNSIKLAQNISTEHIQTTQVLVSINEICSQVDGFRTL